MNEIVIGVAAFLVIVLIICVTKNKESFVGTFGNFGNALTYRGQDIWKNAKLVMIQNDATGMCLTYEPVGMVRLEPTNLANKYQYWIYSPYGYILQPETDTCLSYHSAVDDSVKDGLYRNPIVNICTQSAGQRFYYDPVTKKLINLTGWPYSAVRNIKRESRLKMRCLTYYPIAGGPRCLGCKKVVISPCKEGDHNQKWTIREMTVEQARAAQKAVYGGYTEIVASNDSRNLYPLGNKIKAYNLNPWEYKGPGPRPFLDGVHGQVRNNL